MHILVLGASGRVGQIVVREALSRGHSITALVRNESSLDSFENSNLKVVKGTPTSALDVETAFTTIPNEVPSVVIVALNNSRTSDNPFAKAVSPPSLMHDSHVVVLDAMKKHGCKKIVTLQANGVGDSFPNLFFAMRWVIQYATIGVTFKDHDRVDEIVKKSGVNFVLSRPVRFTGGDTKPVKEYGNKGEGLPLGSGISRESVARFLVDAAEKSDWDGKTPVIAN